MLYEVDIELEWGKSDRTEGREEKTSLQNDQDGSSFKNAARIKACL